MKEPENLEKASESLCNMKESSLSLVSRLTDELMESANQDQKIFFAEVTKTTKKISQMYCDDILTDEDISDYIELINRSADAVAKYIFGLIDPRCRYFFYPGSWQNKPQDWIEDTEKRYNFP